MKKPLFHSALFFVVLWITVRQANALTLYDWQNAVFTEDELADPTITDPTADPFGTGVKNLLAYGLNLDPHSPDFSRLPTPGISGGHLTLNFTVQKNASDLVYIPEVSADLLTWSSGSSAITVLGFTDNGDDTVQATVTDLVDQSTSSRRFIRLRLGQDASGNILGAYWMLLYFDSLDVDPNALAQRGDGLTNLQAYLLGLNPLDFYDGQAPSLSIASGDGQIGSPGSFVSKPLIVNVVDASNSPIVGAPVTFSVTEGGGLLQADTTGLNTTTLTVQANSYGRAIVYFQLPNVQNAQCQITCTPACGSYTASVVFSESSDDGTGIYQSPTLPPASSNGSQPQISAQTYALIDISGDNADGSDVTMIALGDDDKAAFGFVDTTGTNFQVYTWISGTATYNQTVPLSTPQKFINPPPPNTFDESIQQDITYIPIGLLPNGEVYGAVYDQLQPCFNDTNPPNPEPFGASWAYLGFTSTNSTLTYLGASNSTDIDSVATDWFWPFWFQYGAPGGGFAGHIITGATNDGKFCGIHWEWWQPGATVYSFIDGTHFSNQADGGCPTPTALNSNGWAISGDLSKALVSVYSGMPAGLPYYPIHTNSVYNGSGWNDLSDTPAAINNQNWVISGSNNDGWILPSGSTTPQQITSLLPADYQPLLDDINPTYIGNSNTDNGNAITIVFYATDIGSGTIANYVLQVNTSGSNTLSRVELPEGANVQSVTMNAAGIIAGNGKADDSLLFDHAYLEVPVRFVPADSPAHNVKINKGFDPPMRADRSFNQGSGGYTYLDVVDTTNSNSNLKLEWWTNVSRSDPGNGINVNQNVKVVFPDTKIASSCKLVVTSGSSDFTLDQNQQLLSGTEVILKITGANASARSSGTGVIQLQGVSNNPSLNEKNPSLKVDVMPMPRNLTIQFYKLHDPQHDGNVNLPNPDAIQPIPNLHYTNDNNLLDPATSVADKMKIVENMINDCFDQACVHFTVASDVKTLTLPYDGKAPGSRLDGKLDAYEETYILQKYPKGTLSGDIAVICVASFSDTTAGMTTQCYRNTIGDPTYSIVFIPNDLFGGGTTIVYGMDDPATNRTHFYQQLTAHEIGHALGLATRSDPDNGTQAQHHDGGPFPTTTWGLMWGRGNSSGPGKWMRHEDWEKANQVARSQTGQ